MISEPAIREASDVPVDCRHHWVIESAQGATSSGFCKLCAARREFANSCPGVAWEDNHAAPETLRSAPTYSLWLELPRLTLAPKGADKVEADAC